MILQQEVRDYVQRRNKFEDNMYKAYGLIYGQCTTKLRNKLEQRKDFEVIKDKGDPIKLLSAIKEITQNFQDTTYPIATVHKALCDFVTLKQGDKEGLAAYQKRFKNVKDMLEQHLGPILMPEHVKRMEGYNDTKKEEYEKKSYHQLVAYSFIVGADAKKAGQLTKDLANHYALGNNHYPQDLVSPTDTVSTYKGTAAASVSSSGGRNHHNGRFSDTVFKQ